MRPASRFNLPRLIAPLLLLAAGLAHAQYSWIDEKGIRQLSDRPPPPGTPPAKILKAPGKAAAASTAGPTNAAPPTPSGQADAAPPGAYPGEKRDPRPLAVRQKEFVDFLHSTVEAKAAINDGKREQELHCLKLRRYRDALAKGIPMDERGEDGKLRPMTKDERAIDITRSEAELAKCPTPE